ncbi:MAG: biotin/lipoyl-binding protein, partial [Bacteroidales bacterium]
MKKHEIQYSEPVREIMGNPPGKILRWGTMIIFAIFVLFIFFAWLIKYPDIVPAQVEITTENPPASIMSKTTGRIMHLMVSDKQQVKAGDVLAVMENPASFEEVRKLKNFIDTFNLRSDVKIETIPDFYNLGELQTPYETFRKSISDIDNFVKNDYYNARINAVNEELRELKTYTARLQENEKFYNENYLIELNNFRRDSALNAGKSIAPADYENSK